MIGMIATPKSTKGAGSLPVLSLNADLLKKSRGSGAAKGLKRHVFGLGCGVAAAGGEGAGLLGC
jgi:hypothetical protein